MAAKLVIIKQIRPSLDVRFFSASDEQKAAVTSSGVFATVGERLFARGFKKVRTLFFPTVELYNTWEASQAVADITAQRAAHNQANGIVERKVVVDLPNYTL